MSKWEQVRRKAREFHSEICKEIRLSSGTIGDDDEISAKLLIETAANLREIQLKGYPSKSPLLKGTLARTESNKILYNRDIEEWLALYYQAHEFAHIELKHGARECTEEDINCEATESKIPLGVHRVEGYGPHERIECEANIFAREFLLPCFKLKKWFIQDGLNAEEIEAKTGMGLEMICHQLAYAILTPEISLHDEGSDELETNGKKLDLDCCQKAAATVPEGPQILEAGPGTGKTRTLVGRVLHLLDRNVKPENILVLTFSNKAAEELRQRIERFAPEESAIIKVETFHSFGLELLRKYGTKIGLKAKPQILDPIDALFILEQFLPELNLDHYQNLYDPAMYLGDILKAISRAKDENISPAGYLKLAENQKEKAETDDENKAAEKVLEIAEVYKFYQCYLKSEKNLLDFGDLITRSIELLKEHKNVRNSLRSTYSHILVDEYQDINRASGLFLKELAGDGLGLWAVGDIRQSIHRWRGATTANMRQFSKDFPLAKENLDLKKNYRSKPDIVDLFSAFAPSMKATLGTGFNDWKKSRSNEGVTIKFEVAADQDAEAIGIAKEIIHLQNEKGIPLKEQAIICRSHTSLARIAKILEQEEVPVLYLGDFFERPEIRDMLSLLSLACEPDGRGLVRVARFPEYDIPLEDVRHLHRIAKEKSVPFPKALELSEDIKEISLKGRDKIKLLATHLQDLCHGRSAWKTLTRYLLVNSNYLKPMLAGTSVKIQQEKLALYQFLQFANNQLGVKNETGIDSKKSLLDYIRKLEMYGNEKQLRQSTEWADGIDAVRIQTIHASKGLEYRVVFLPVLATSYFPSQNRPEHCPPPFGLIAEENNDWRVEEEECLFFVALSRARDYICVSRALRYGKVNRKNSTFLQPISRLLPHFDKNVSWDYVGKAEEQSEKAPILPKYEIPTIFDIRELEVYLKCPRKYMYEFVLGLSGKRDDTAYLQFHKCVYKTVQKVKTEHKKGITANEKVSQKYLDEIWDERGPTDHYLENIYKDAARSMVTNAVKRIRSAANLISTDFEVSLPEGKVVLSVDHAEISDEDKSNKNLFFQRFRTGKPTKKESEKPIYGLLLKAAADLYTETDLRLQILYLGADYAEDIIMTDTKINNRVKKYNDAILNIKTGEFQPTPNDHDCPRCPHYHICPAAEDSI